LLAIKKDCSEYRYYCFISDRKTGTFAGTSQKRKTDLLEHYHKKENGTLLEQAIKGKLAKIAGTQQIMKLNKITCTPIRVNFILLAHN